MGASITGRTLLAAPRPVLDTIAQAAGFENPQLANRSELVATLQFILRPPYRPGFDPSAAQTALVAYLSTSIREGK